jgi:hypothetical protein
MIVRGRSWRSIVTLTFRFVTEEAAPPTTSVLPKRLQNELPSLIRKGAPVGAAVVENAATSIRKGNGRRVGTIRHRKYRLGDV